MRCPACSTTTLSAEGQCKQCGGIFLAEREVVARAERELDLGRPKLATLPCPVCEKLMPSAALFGIAIDRCAEHGIWFEKTELELVLARARDDEWRLYGGDRWIEHEATPVDGLTEVVHAIVRRLFRRSRS